MYHNVNYVKPHVQLYLEIMVKLKSILSWFSVHSSAKSDGGLKETLQYGHTSLRDLCATSRIYMKQVQYLGVVP